MKTIFKLTTLLAFTIVAQVGSAQGICAGGSTTVTALNSSNLSSPSYSLNPGGIISSNPTFTVSPSSTTTYTVYVTGTNSNSAVVTTSSTNTITVWALPTFSLTSAQAFSLGCGSKSLCTVQVINAQTVPAGGPVSYTILSPGSTAVSPSGTLSALSTYTVNTPGAWSVAVRDGSNLCTSWTTMNITIDTTAPNISATVPQQTLDCNLNSVQLQGNSSTSNVSYLWDSQIGLAASNSITVNTNSSSLTTTLIANYTLTATDNNNTCKSTTVIPMYQNLFPPNALIAGSGTPPFICTHTVILTNQSSTGIPMTVPFPTNSNVVGYLWEGPSPQSNLSLSSTYTAQITGVYTMTAKDMNNGCTSKANYTFHAGAAAAFTHTITGGTANFSNASSISAPSSTSYFWDFGDGNTSTLENPTHNYSNGGAYLVKFKIMDASIPCSDSVIQSINISGVPCSANSSFSMIPTGTAQVWNATPNYPWNVSSARWDWGDGYFSNTLYTSHQYASAGMYNICLSVTVSCGDTSTSCTSYSVYRSMQEAMILEVNVVAPELVTGIESVKSNETLNWNIVPNPNSGTFKVNFTTINSEPIHVKISDLSGRIIHDQLLEHDSDMVIESSGLVPGMYLVTLETKNIKTTKRMIVSH